MILNSVDQRSLNHLEMNRDHFVVFEIAPKYYILDSFVDYEGYSISSEEFLSTGVDTMVIRIIIEKQILNIPSCPVSPKRNLCL